MSIPPGLKVTKLVNGMDFVTLGTGEALLCEEEVDRLNTPYKGYGYAKDLSNNNQQPIIILSEQITENEEAEKRIGQEQTEQYAKDQTILEKVKKQVSKDVFEEIEFEMEESEHYSNFRIINEPLGILQRTDKIKRL